MLPGFLTKTFMTRVVRAFPTQAFIGDSILPMRETASFRAMWDIINNDERLAPFVSINSESPLANKENLTQAFHELAYIRQKSRVDEDELINLRMPGEPDQTTDPMGATKRATAEAYLRRESDRMTGRVWSRVEWMRWQALLGGVITYVPDPGDPAVQFSVNFGIPVTNQVQLLLGARWNQFATADPLGDIATWMEASRAASRRVPTTMYVGGNIASYLVNNAAIRTLLSGTEAITALLSPNKVLDFVGSLVGLKIQRYDAAFTNAAGVAVPFLNADGFVMIPDPVQPDGEILGEVLTGPAKANDYSPGIYGWVKEEEDPWETYIGAGIHCFPALYHPNWIFCGFVV